MRKAKSYGFSLVEALIVLVVVIILAAGGWFVWKHNSRPTDKNTDPYNTRPSKPKNDNSKWIEYKDYTARIKFNYPGNWKHVVNGPVIEYDRLSTIDGKLTSPNGTLLQWHYTPVGGGGGDCDPAPDDIPFAEGNICNSKQIYSVEHLPSPSESNNELIRDMQFILTTTKYRSSQAGSPTTYHICLDAYYPSNGAPKIGTRMGLAFPCGFWKTGFNVEFQVPNGNFKAAEAKTAEKIMRTFDTF